jgi:hypothetical protein
MGGDRTTFSSRPTSHLPGALLTFEELAGIKCSIAAAERPPARARDQGLWCRETRQVQLDFRRKYLGIFETFAAAAAFRTGYVAVTVEAEWQAYRASVCPDNGVAVHVGGEHGCDERGGR